MARGANDRPVPTTRPPDAGSPWRSAIAVVALALAYVGFVLGAQAPDLRVGQGPAALQSAQGARHLATRDVARATAAAETPDPRGPVPHPDPVLVPVATAPGLPASRRPPAPLRTGRRCPPGIPVQPTGPVHRPPSPPDPGP